MATTDDTLERSLANVARWVEERDYKGYDPGDGLTSFLRPLTCGSLFAERLLQQAIWKSPWNIRPLVGVKPLDSTKGRGFMAWGYLLLFKATGDDTYRTRAVACLDWLMAHTSPSSPFFCWGNHFDFSSRSGRIPAHQPTIVWTGLIGQAFLEAYEQLGDPRYLDVARSICDWIVQLPREKSDAGACISYVPSAQLSIHNSNLLGAAMLAHVWRHTHQAEYLALAHSAVAYTCSHQMENGAWWYGEQPRYHWVDNFHTAYNLDSIKRYIGHTGDESFTPQLNKGFHYFVKTFFDDDGCPRYYHNKRYPIDIQCAAQAIDTLAFFADDFPEALPLAERVAAWTIANMQDRGGYFCYRKYPAVTSRTAYIHWGQATTFKAFAHVHLKQCERLATRWLGGHPELVRTNTLSYVLITPAWNEAGLIEATIRSVVAQSVLPLRWIIVSDGSTDGTDDIVRRYAAQYPWIELVRMPEHPDRQFAAKAHGFNAGYERVRELSFDLVGNLDADITFDADYYHFLLTRFVERPGLGVAGTPFVENDNRPDAHTYDHSFANLQHVSGAAQMFRRECLEQVGGYVPVKDGAIDWIAVTTARMKGWETRTFTEKVCRHHRKLGTGTGAEGALRMRFHYGRKAYYVGGHPLWEISRGLFAIRHRPFLLGGLFFICGYAWAALRRTERAVSRDLIQFHRGEQMARFRRLCRRSASHRITPA